MHFDGDFCLLNAVSFRIASGSIRLWIFTLLLLDFMDIYLIIAGFYGFINSACLLVVAKCQTVI
jgi:hypothetical protein